MAPAAAPVYFTDENLLGLAKLLTRSGRTDVVHPGHPSLPEVPLGCPDLEWMPVVAAKGLIVLTREKRIRTRPVELSAYREHGIRSVRIGGKRDLSLTEQVLTFERHEGRMLELADELGRGPWALVVTGSGVRELVVPAGIPQGGRGEHDPH